MVEHQLQRHHRNLIVAGGLVLVSDTSCYSNSNYDGHVTALNAITGVEQWRSTGSWMIDTVVADAGTIVTSGYCGTCDGFEHGAEAYRLSDGARLWSKENEVLAGPVSAHGRILLARTSRAETYAATIGTGTMIWRTGGTSAAVAATPAGDQFYLTTAAGLTAVDGGTGRQRWRIGKETGDLAADGRRVYVASAGSINTYDAKTGRLLWTRGLTNPSTPMRIEPAAKRHEVLSFVRSGLQDISVSRPASRAPGWGIPVPDDPDQVIYVWWDALANYVTALGYGTDDPAYRTWWLDGAERVHVIGKGIVRFHTMYWLALLISTGQPLPTAIFVHEYLTVDGAKISKTAGNTVDPHDLAARYGTDALRWWLLRKVARVGDTDFTEQRLLARYHQDLAHGVGNLVNRTLSLVHKYRHGTVPDQDQTNPVGRELIARSTGLPATIDRGLAAFDFRAAIEAIGAVVAAANRLIETERPWDLARREQSDDLLAGQHLDAVLATLVEDCRRLAHELTPFIPAGAARMSAQLGHGTTYRNPTAGLPRVEQAHS